MRKDTIIDVLEAGGGHSRGTGGQTKKWTARIRNKIDLQWRVAILFALALLQFLGILLPDKYHSLWLFLLTPVSMFLLWAESIGAKKKYRRAFYACIAVQAVCLGVVLVKKIVLLLMVSF